MVENKYLLKFKEVYDYMNKRYDRLIYSISALFNGYLFLKNFAFDQGNYILGIIVFFVFLGLAIMYLDLSGIFKTKFNKHYNVNNYKYMIDAVGIMAVLYLFVKALR